MFFFFNFLLIFVFFCRRKTEIQWWCRIGWTCSLGKLNLFSIINIFSLSLSFWTTFLFEFCLLSPSLPFAFILNLYYLKLFVSPLFHAPFPSRVLSFFRYLLSIMLSILSPFIMWRLQIFLFSFSQIFFPIFFPFYFLQIKKLYIKSKWLKMKTC